MISVLLLGFVNGARTFTAPAVVAWAAAGGVLQVAGSRVAFLGASSAPAVVLTALALLELFADKQPQIPSRKSPAALAARVVAAALVGAAIGTHVGAPGLATGLAVACAVVGTYATYAARARLAQHFGQDRPAALLEDTLVIAVALAAVAPFLMSAPAQAAQAPSGLERTTPLIAVATAFAPEFDALAPFVEDAASVEHNGVTFLRGSMAGVRVVLFRTGISTVNAAMTTQLAIDRLAVQEIVVSGIAGSLDERLTIGDVAVPARWGRYDEMIFLRDTDDPLAALPPGMAPDFAPFDFMAPRAIPVASVTTPSAERRFWYAADEALLAAAARAAGGLELAACFGGASRCLSSTPSVHMGGNAVSGSVFLDNARFRDYLRRTFQAQVVEMETAAIAQVAYANGLPFVAFRSVSDLAGGHRKGNDMRVFMELAADNAARLVRAYLAERAREPGR